MKTIERLVAEKLMAIKAVKLQPNNPFTWASGWHSPIYCDNRKTLAFPDIRTIIKTGLVNTIQRTYGDKVDAIAGVATGAIAQGALVADALGKPFVSLRAMTARMSITGSASIRSSTQRMLCAISSALRSGLSIVSDSRSMRWCDGRSRCLSALPIGPTNSNVSSHESQCHHPCLQRRTLPLRDAPEPEDADDAGL